MEKVSKGLPFSAEYGIISTTPKGAYEFSFLRKDELMREAKFVATVFGVITACLFGGGVVAFQAAPQVSTRANIVEPASEERTISATETTTATTIVTTTKITTQKTTADTTSKKVSTAAAVKYETVVDYETLQMYNSVPVVTTAAPAETTVTTTQAVVTEPVTEAAKETVTQAPVVTTTVTTKPAEPVTSEEPTYEEPTTEPSTEVTEPSVDADASASGNTLPISESEFIMLCNVVGHEAGSYWISEYEKALVVEVIMNRVYSPLYPNTIYGVLTQPYQFSGCESYVNLGTFSHYVTENVKNAVRLYFSEPESFAHGYLSFYGDGYRNYFR